MSLHHGSFCSLLVVGESALAPNNLTPLARLVAWDVVGCDPEIMGIGPAGAIRGALRKARLSLEDMDLIEVHAYIMMYIYRVYMFTPPNLHVI